MLKAMQKAARLLVSSIERVSVISGVVGGVALCVSMLLITIEVVLRYGFNTSTLIAHEVSGYLVVVILFCALSYTLQRGEHITIRVVVDRLSARSQRLLGQIVALLTLPIFTVLCWHSWRFVLESYRVGTISRTIIHTPQYIPQLVVAVGLSLLVGQMLVEIFKRFAIKVVGEESD